MADAKQLAEALGRLIDASMVSMTDKDIATEQSIAIWNEAIEALAAHEAQAALAAEPVMSPKQTSGTSEPVAWLHPTHGHMQRRTDSMTPEIVEAYRKNGWTLLYAAPVAQAEPAWQPIETAPKDGSEFLLGVWEGEWSNPRKRFTVYHAHGFCNRPVWAANYRTEEGEAYEIAGWMPLPQPPKEQP